MVADPREYSSKFSHQSFSEMVKKSAGLKRKGLKRSRADNEESSADHEKESDVMVDTANPKKKGSIQR